MKLTFKSKFKKYNLKSKFKGNFKIGIKKEL
jgi:hypothetical protein